MSKRLLITSTDLMMIQFLIPHVIHLSEAGLEIEIACSEVGDRMREVREKLSPHVRAIHTVRLVRSPASLGNIKGYADMKRIINAGSYDMIWTNEPVMGVVTRLAAAGARKRGTKVTYMVHGFHFYKGAPMVNWLVFYPIERLASRFCDEIVTINREDYQRAKKKMHAPSVKYIHGIGINTDRLTRDSSCTDIRQELKLPRDSFLVLSVGELNENKNQKTILYALKKLNERNIHYILCGKGALWEPLRKLADELQLTDRVHFLGYRTDVVNICSQADVFVMPSKREGLPVASLEAMYCGLPLITSNIRGLTDVMEDGKSGFLCNPDDAAGFAADIWELYKNPRLRKTMAQWNRRTIVPFCIESTMQEVKLLFW